MCYCAAQSLSCFNFCCQSFEKRTTQDPLKKLTARALMTLLACSPTAQNYAVKGNPPNVRLELDYHLSFTLVSLCSSIFLNCVPKSSSLKQTCFWAIFVIVLKSAWITVETWYLGDSLTECEPRIVLCSSWFNWHLCGAAEANSYPAPLGVSPAQQGFPPQKGEHRLAGNFQSQHFFSLWIE